MWKGGKVESKDRFPLFHIPDCDNLAGTKNRAATVAEYNQFGHPHQLAANINPMLSRVKLHTAAPCMGSYPLAAMKMQCVIRANGMQTIY